MHTGLKERGNPAEWKPAATGWDSRKKGYGKKIAFNYRPRDRTNNIGRIQFARGERLRLGAGIDGNGGGGGGEERGFSQFPETLDYVSHRKQASRRGCRILRNGNYENSNYVSVIDDREFASVDYIRGPAAEMRKRDKGRCEGDRCKRIE